MSSTIDQVFQARGLWRWYASTVTNAYDGRNEKGQDYSTTFGTPVGVPIGGKIVRIVHNNNSIGDVVELMDAGGAVWLYQHITATVKPGQVLQCGDIIGTENGLPVDQFSTGPHIEVRYAAPGTWKANTDSWVEPWVNPRAVFASIGQQQAGTTGPYIPVPYGWIGSPGGDGNGNPFNIALIPALKLAPNADVKQLLQTIDQAFDVVNPFDMVGAQQDSILGATFTDPMSWIEGFGSNLVVDLRGLTLRLILLLLGVYVIWKVFGDFIDFGAIGSNVQAIPQAAGGIVGQLLQ